jgi:hypothetical protein
MADPPTTHSFGGGSGNPAATDAPFVGRLRELEVLDEAYGRSHAVCAAGPLYVVRSRRALARAALVRHFWRRLMTG